MYKRHEDAENTCGLALCGLLLRNKTNETNETNEKK